MKKITAIVQTHSGTVTWPAYTTSTPGLVVCRHPWQDYDNPGGFKPGDGWRIVHVASGRMPPMCSNFRTRRNAALFAYMLGSIADWELDEGELLELSRQDRDAGKGWPDRFREMKQRVFGK